MTLCFITVLTLPQSANAFTPDNQICFASDIGNHSVVISNTIEIAPVFVASIPLVAEHSTFRLRTSPKLVKQSKYINTNFACSKCLLNGNSNSNGWRLTTIKQPDSNS